MDHIKKQPPHSEDEEEEHQLLNLRITSTTTTTVIASDKNKKARLINSPTKPFSVGSRSSEIILKSSNNSSSSNNDNSSLSDDSSDDEDITTTTTIQQQQGPPVWTTCDVVIPPRGGSEGFHQANMSEHLTGFTNVMEFVGGITTVVITESELVNVDLKPLGVDVLLILTTHKASSNNRDFQRRIRVEINDKIKTTTIQRVVEEVRGRLLGIHFLRHLGVLRNMMKYLPVGPLRMEFVRYALEYRVHDNVFDQLCALFKSKMKQTYEIGKTLWVPGTQLTVAVGPDDAYYGAMFTFELLTVCVAHDIVLQARAWVELKNTKYRTVPNRVVHFPSYKFNGFWGLVQSKMDHLFPLLRNYETFMRQNEYLLEFAMQELKKSEPNTHAAYVEVGKLMMIGKGG
jgi:hypothetical protein